MADKLHMRPFRDKGDVERMMRRLFGRSAAEQQAFDPITVAAFLAQGGSFPGAFSALHATDNPPDDFAWEWYFAPADTAITAITSVWERHEKFWNPGQSIIPSEGSQFPNGPLSGWYFRPSHIMIAYFTSADARKTGHVANIFTPTVVGRIGATAGPLGRARLGVEGHTAVQEIQDFSVQPQRDGGNLSIHALFPYLLFAGQPILFSGITGLVFGDQILTTMIGDWRFNPRFIPDFEEANT